MLLISGLVLIVRGNTIYIPDVGITGCPLGDNPQILNLRRSFCLSTFFHRKIFLHIFNQSARNLDPATLDGANPRPNSPVE